ncbi:Uncharacterised protein [Chlamydia trachomatis]|nr:Uncharacterised protein [Chlamydia trachomatis]
MDLYNNNKDNAVYLKSLSNLFFEGSQNTYSLDRTVTIQSSGNNLTVTLNFPKYGDINGG